MSTTTITVAGDTPTIVSTAPAAEIVIEHGTINQPYIGPTIYVQTTAPVSPVTGSVWYDTTP